MARQIADTQEATLTKVETEEGTTFIKNHLNEIVVLPNGTKHRFKKPRETYTDKKLIEGLRKVADHYGIIEVTK